jgi:hypothetical protein
MKKILVALLFLAATAAFGQGRTMHWTIVENGTALPASPAPGRPYVIKNGATANDCTTRSGAFLVVCYGNAAGDGYEGQAVDADSSAASFTDLDTDYGNETITVDFDFGGGTLQVPNSTTLPGSCEVGDTYMDTDATSGERWNLCEATDSWIVQGGGGTLAGDVDGPAGSNDLDEVAVEAELEGVIDLEDLQGSLLESQITFATNDGSRHDHVEVDITNLSHFTPSTIDTDYGDETVVSTWTFTDVGTGANTAYDLRIGDIAPPSFGGLQIGRFGLYSSSFSAGGMDLGGAALFRQEEALDVGNDPGIEFAFSEAGNTMRLLIPESGAGNAMAFIRSGTFAGPYSQVTGNDTVLCDTWTAFDSNIDCDTGTTGADLFVQDDLEVEGTIFAHETINFEGATADGNQVILQVGADPGSDITITLPTASGALVTGAHFSPTAGIDTDHGAGAIDATTDFAGALCGTGEYLVDDGASWSCDPVVTPDGVGYDTIDEDGTPLTQRATLNMIGTIVTCVDDGPGTETDCTWTDHDGTGTDDQVASEVPYTVDDTGEWAGADPTEVDAALEHLAPRVFANDAKVTFPGFTTVSGDYGEDVTDDDLSDDLPSALSNVTTLTNGQFCVANAGGGFDCTTAGALADDNLGDDLPTALSNVTTMTDGDLCEGNAGGGFDCDVSPHAGTDLTADLEEEGQINTTNVTGNAADDQVLTGSGASAMAYKTIPDCNTNNMLTYTQSTNTWGCDADDGAGGGAPVGVQYVVGASDATLTAEKILTDGMGIDTVISGGDAGAATINLAIAALGTDPALGVHGVSFGQSELVFEGSSDDANELRMVITNPTAERTLSVPNADSVTVQAFDCSAGNFADSINVTTGVVSCVAESATFSPTAGIDTDHGAGAIDATADFAGALCGTAEYLVDDGASWSCDPVVTPFSPNASPSTDHSSFDSEVNELIGATVGDNAADLETMVGTGASTAVWTPLPAGGTDGCSGAGDKPIWTASTRTWSCGTDGGGTVGDDHIDALTEIAQGIKTAANDTDPLAVFTGGNPAGNRCVEINSSGQMLVAADTCANLGPGGTPTQIVAGDSDVTVTDAGSGDVGITLDSTEVGTWTNGADILAIVHPAITVSTTDDATLELAATLNDTSAGGATEVFSLIDGALTLTDVTGWDEVNLLRLEAGGSGMRLEPDGAPGATSTKLHLTESARSGWVEIEDFGGGPRIGLYAAAGVNIGITTQGTDRALVQNGSGTLAMIPGAGLNYSTNGDQDTGFGIPAADTSAIYAGGSIGLQVYEGQLGSAAADTVLELFDVATAPTSNPGAGDLYVYVDGNKPQFRNSSGTETSPLWSEGDTMTGNLSLDDGVGDSPTLSFSEAVFSSIFSIELTADPTFKIYTTSTVEEFARFANDGTSILTVEIETSNGVYTDLKDAAHLVEGTVPVARVGDDHIDALTEIAQGIKSGANDTDPLALFTGGAPGSTECVEVTTGGLLQASGAACGGGGGAFSADVDTQITPTTAITLDHATNNEIALLVDPTVNKAAGNYTALKIDATETSAPGSDNRLLDLGVGGTTLSYFDSAGQLNLDANLAYGVGTGLGFGNHDSDSIGRIYESSDDTLTLKWTQINFTFAVAGWSMGQDDFWGTAGAGPRLRRVTAGATNVTVAPDEGDTDTGLSAPGADILGFVAGGVADFRIYEGGLGSAAGDFVFSLFDVTTAPTSNPGVGDLYCYVEASEFTCRDSGGALHVFDDDDLSDDLITALSGVTTVTDGSYCQGGATSTMDCDVTQANIPGTNHIDATTEIAASMITEAHMATEDFGDWSCAGAADDCTLDAAVVDAAAADPVLDTRVVTISILDPTTANDDRTAFVCDGDNGCTITKVWCSTDTLTVSINFEERTETGPNSAGTDVLSSALVCDSGSQSSCASGCDVNTITNGPIDRYDPIRLMVDAAGAANEVNIHVEYTVTD